MAAPAAAGQIDRTKAGQRTNKDEQPLPPFTEKLEGKREEVRGVEVRKATAGLPLNKAPGAGGVSAAIYRKMPVLIPYGTRICSEVIRTSRILKTQGRTHLAPLIKAGKNPQKVGSRRPISLICTQVEIVETIIYHRMLERIEPDLSQTQRAYRRGRGTEILLLEMAGRIDEEPILGNYICLMSFDIAGAFGCVPRNQLRMAPKEHRLGGHQRRVVRNWLRYRAFQVKMEIASGVHLFPIRPISRGLPQGGALSPLL